MNATEEQGSPRHVAAFRDDELDLQPASSTSDRCGAGSCSCGGRRGFLKGLIGGGIAVFSGGTSAALDGAGAPHRHLPPGDPAVRRGVPGRKWVMVIDLAKCDGCGKCSEACAKMHFIPPDRQWIKVLKVKDSEETVPYYFPQPCFQCDNPPCTKVCPVDATFKRQDGIVLIDNDRCIGCRFCMAACPYNARSFNWGTPVEPDEARTHEYSPERGTPRKVGTVEKCDFCPDIAAQGKLPPCTEICPMGAIFYGDENEDAVTNAKGETVRFKKLLEDHAGYQHRAELGTKPRVHYLPPHNRMYPPPKEVGKHEPA